MPEFNDAQQVEQICYELKLADFPRGLNRARINQLFNGHPPYTAQEAQENGVVVNVNSLEGTGIAHDARAQFAGVFTKTGNYFSLSTDMGTVHRRDERATVASRAINKRLKNSLDYFECNRSEFALDVLHGIGPAVWNDDFHWCPDPMGIEDVLIPGKTLLTMKNLPLFAIYHSFTAPELIKLTRGPFVDPGWNQDLVKSAIEWVDRETLQLLGSTWPEVWSPEKMEERVKGDGGFYPGDTAPSVDCFDFYFWADDGDNSGWRRRIILDSWGAPQASGSSWAMARREGSIFDKKAKSQFLYSSGNRYVADHWRHLVAFQFADLSAVAPFQYHSTRGLGFLLYSVCHLQNRMRCKFSEAVFEALLNYFRIKNADDVQRTLKVQLANRGFIDDGVEFLKAAERWQVPAPLVQMGLAENQQLINRHGSLFSMAPQQGSQEKSATQWIGEAQNATQLVSAGLNQAYQYKRFEYDEIKRRFFKRHSKDPDVIAAQAEMLAGGIPPEMMIPEAWETHPERVLGGGNMSLEMGIANWLMQNIDRYEPDAQSDILRKSTFTITGDPGLTNLLVPEKKSVSNSVHDAQLAAGTLLQSLPMALKQGVNHQEYAEALLAAMVQQVSKITQRNNVATLDELQGLQNLAGQTIQGAPIQGNGIRAHIAVLAKNPEEKKSVAQLQQKLMRVMNLVRAFAQRLQQQQSKVSAGADGGEGAQAAAKIAVMQAEAAAKNQDRQTSHAQRTAQRQLSWEMEERRKQREFEEQTKRDNLEHVTNLAQQMREKQFAGVEE